MEKKNGNGQQEGDLIVGLHAEVIDLRESMDRQHRETQAELDRLQATFARHHKENDQHLGRIARMLMVVGDRLNDHERRLAAVETKLS